MDKSDMKGYRPSSYIIDVPLEDDRCMLVHGYTGAVDIVSDNVSVFLKHTGTPTKGKSCISKSAFEILVRRGYLTNKNETEEVLYVQKMADLLHRRSKLIYCNFVFAVTYDCNFCCPYCYEKGITGAPSRKLVFTKSMVDKAYLAINEISSGYLRPSKQITLYGGEPLLKENYEIVQYIVGKGKALGYRFIAVTNAYDLDCFASLLGQDMISGLQVTLDGMPQHHNRRRIHRDGSPTFDRIMHNISLALDKGCDVSIRTNTDADNFDDLLSLDRKFKEAGFYAKIGNFRPYSALLVDYSAGQLHTGLKYLQSEQFDLLHSSLHYVYDCNATNLTKEIYNVLTNRTTLHFSPIFCSAQAGSYILDPSGDIYSCWDECGHKDAVIGSYLHNDGIKWFQYRDQWQKCNISSSEKCIRCKYAFLCRGGCVSHTKMKTNKLEPGLCNDFPHLFRDAAAFAYKQYLYDTAGTNVK